MKLYYAHDPMCSWCWAFRPALLKLIESLPEKVEFIQLLGGLAPDDNYPMSEDIRERVLGNWRRIEKEIPGTRFNYDFWEFCMPRRSTYPACRALIAARMQKPEAYVQMNHAIQEAYYLHARNPSDVSTLQELADEIGLDIRKFKRDIFSVKTVEALQEEIMLCLELGLKSFPGLLLDTGNKKIIVEPNYTEPEKMIIFISELINGSTY